MNTMKRFASLCAGSALVAAAAFADCEPTESGSCCTYYTPQGQCIEEVSCSECRAPSEPTESPTTTDPLPDEPFPYPSCGDMGAC